MVGGIHATLIVVDQTEVSSRCAEGDRIDPALGPPCAVAQMPSRTEQTPLARIASYHGDAAIVRVWRWVGSKGAGPRPDGARADAIVHVAEQRATRLDDVGQAFDRLGHRTIIGGMNDG